MQVNNGIWRKVPRGARGNAQACSSHSNKRECIPEAGKGWKLSESCRQHLLKADHSVPEAGNLTAGKNSQPHKEWAHPAARRLAHRTGRTQQDGDKQVRGGTRHPATLEAYCREREFLRGSSFSSVGTPGRTLAISPTVRYLFLSLPILYMCCFLLLHAHSSKSFLWGSKLPQSRRHQHHWFLSRH